MQTIRAIIIDDEESARDVLENLLKRFCPNVQVIDKCGSLPQGVDSIKSQQPDLVFLDIEMPNYAGYEIVNFFNSINFNIIFVTAYEQYAVKAFELSAIDYLLKPVDINRLRGAIEKVETQQNLLDQAERFKVLSTTLEHKSIKNIVVTDKKLQHIIPVETIIAIEAQESYCILHCTDKKLIASKNLKHFETLLEELPAFFRTHKSWLINTNHLVHYSKSEFTITLSQNTIAKLSKYKKSEFETAIPV